MQSLDVEALIVEDQNAPPGIPERFAYGFDVNIDLLNQGNLTIDENGNKIWRLSIKSENAIGMKVHFNEFYIPNESFIRIYSNGQMSDVRTFEDNHESETYENMLLKGDLLSIEYFESKNSNRSGKIKISKVYHAYKDVFGFYNQGSNDRGYCSYNVACDQSNTGGSWEDPINSVLYMEAGGGICSAALINNTSGDLKPYVLTANHCISSNPYEAGDAQLGYFNYRLYFNHQSSSCSGSGGNYSQYIQGATVVAAYGYSDFALLELNQQPPSWWNAYYAGWNRYASSPTLGAGIHHPSGYPKEINYDNDQPSSTSWFGGGSTHWEFYWDDGGTAGGSSGSPLFDSNKRIVGQLHGGTGGDCGGIDIYGKISASWNGGGASTSRLKDWLDPLDSGVYTLSGTYTGTPPVEITSPLSGDEWQAGDTYQITWDESLSGNVSLTLYKAGVNVQTIASSVSINNRSYTWNIDSGLEQSDLYKIKIQSLSYDYNDFTAYFSIVEPPTITLLSPILGDGVQVGLPNQITWTSNFDDNISLKLYKGNNVSTGFVSTITSSVPASNGSYTWTPSSSLEERDDYKIKATRISNSSTYDYSSFFSVLQSIPVELSINSVVVTQAGGVIYINMVNDEPVSGYEFNIKDSPDYLEIVGVQDLISSGFEISYSEVDNGNESGQGQVLGYTFSTPIEPSEHLLLGVQFESVNNGQEVEICLEDSDVSDSIGNSLFTQIGPCVTTLLVPTILPGDVTLDGSVNVADVVLLVAGILDNQELSASAISAGDVNFDASLNVSDVILIVNIILDN
tara:strand:+ start:5623 stop:8007 length:2385 start_codon:yes stop_codon:yes gene_type:complete